MMPRDCKRLVEVALPIAEVWRQPPREKSIWCLHSITSYLSRLRRLPAPRNRLGLDLDFSPR
jgi:hypothetical protein